MQTDRNEELRRQAAAENLARRKQQLRKNKRKKQQRLKLFILAGLIIAAALFLMIGCMSHARKAAGTEDADSGAQTAEEGGIVMGLKGSAVQLVLQGDPYIENGAFAIDTRSGALAEDVIKVKGKVDTSKPGDYTVTYKVKNEGKSAKAERTVRVLTEEEFGDKAGNVPVMMYHWVYTADDVPDNLDGNWILDTVLDEHLAYLSENEFYYPGWKELRAWIDDEISLPAKCTVLTFDDGTEAFLKNGKPVIEKYKIPVTSFIIGYKNNAPKKIKKYASPYIEFESHTYAMHQKCEPPVNGHKGIMATMTGDEIKADLEQEAELVGSNDALAYPYGDYSDDMLEAVRKQGVKCSFTVEYDRVRKGMDPAKLPRIRVLGDESFQIWKDSVY